MPRYRLVKRGAYNYVAQRKFLFWWLDQLPVGCSSVYSAEHFIADITNKQVDVVIKHIGVLN